MADEKLPKSDGILPGLPPFKSSPNSSQDAIYAGEPPWSSSKQQGEKSPPSFPFGGLPSYGSYLSPTGENAEVVHLYECGDCGIPSRDVRFYSLLTIIFVYLFFAWRVDEMMKCPRCMRRHILIRLPLAILLSNLVSPLVVAWWLFMLIRTFIKPF